MSQAALQSGDNGLRAIRDIETHEDDAYVGFDGGLFDAQFFGDFAIASATHEQGEDFALARTEFGAREARGKSARYGRWNESSASMDLAQCVDEGLVRHAFDEIAARSGFEGLMDILIAFIGSEHDETRLRGEAANFANGLNAAAVREAQIHQSDVWPVFVE